MANLMLVETNENRPKDGLTDEEYWASEGITRDSEDDNIKTLLEDIDDLEE